MQIKHFIFLTICCVTCSFVLAQTDSVPSYNRDKALQLYVGAGGAYNNYKHLNATFEDASLPTVGKFSLNNSIEAGIRHKNFLIGLSGTVGASYRRPDDYNVLLLNFGQQLNAGYYVLNHNKFHFGPQAGIGFLSSLVNVTQRKNIDDYNELLADKNSISINQNSAVLDFCLRFDFADFTKRKSGAGSIKLGYKYGLNKRGWGIDATSNSTIDNSPEDRINQFYILLSAGVSLLKPEHLKQ